MLVIDFYLKWVGKKVKKGSRRSIYFVLGFLFPSFSAIFLYVEKDNMILFDYVGFTLKIANKRYQCKALVISGGCYSIPWIVSTVIPGMMNYIIETLMQNDIALCFA